MIIWHVLEGPYQTPYDDEGHYRLLCKVQTEEEDKISKEEIVFYSFKGAYEVKKYFDTNINPLDEESMNLLIEVALGEEDYEQDDERAN